MDPLTTLILEIVETWWDEVSLAEDRDLILEDAREGWFDQLTDPQRVQILATLDSEPHLLTRMQVDISNDTSIAQERRDHLARPITRFINLDADGCCWRDSDTRLPETHATKELAEAAAERDWQARRKELLESNGPEALEGETKEETFACTVDSEGHVTLADGATVIPANDEPPASTEPDPRLVTTDYDPNS
jgi:hypothetical protein